MKIWKVTLMSLALSMLAPFGFTPAMAVENKGGGLPSLAGTTEPGVNREALRDKFQQHREELKANIEQRREQFKQQHEAMKQENAAMRDEFKQGFKQNREQQKDLRKSNFEQRRENRQNNRDERHENRGAITPASTDSGSGPVE